MVCGIIVVLRIFVVRSILLVFWNVGIKRFFIIDVVLGFVKKVCSVKVIIIINSILVMLVLSEW